MEFFCTACQQGFEAPSPTRKEFQDPVYGTCWTYISACPVCHQDSSEKKTQKTRVRRDLSLDRTSPPCSTGGGCPCCG